MATALCDSAALTSALDTVFRRFVSRHRYVHHAVVAVSRGDGSFRWSAACGDAHPGGPRFDADSPYFIASITKLCSANIQRRRKYLELSVRRDDAPAHLRTRPI